MDAHGPSLDLARAHGRWLSRGVLAFPPGSLPAGLAPESLEWRLHWAADGGIDVWAHEPVAWESAALSVLEEGLPAELVAEHPSTVGMIALRAPAHLDVESILRGQVAVAVRKQSGRLVAASGLQLAGVLDDVYADAVDAILGHTLADGVPTLRVWAPTAHEVSLLRWGPDRPLDAEPEAVAMTREPDGCWAVTGTPSWRGARYLYAVTVFVPAFLRVVTNRVTDPYSLALTANSTHSVLVDLDAPETVPDQWRTAAQPTLEHPVDQTIYELHVRDFSQFDTTVPEALRGSYLAFTVDGHGTAHLRALAAAGLNTVQLLPIFDNSTLEELRPLQERPDSDHLRGLPPDSEEQQRYLRRVVSRRAFNWGYDPWHFMVPEGGYATEAGVDGGARVREARAMIGALHGLGLRVVLDQVHNHTSGEGQVSHSVLSRILPGYYHRVDMLGVVHMSTCCPNIATEHLMAEKLMIDSVVGWARRYKVDGFRFDLMGHHSRDNMVKVRAALDALTPERDGVLGTQVTLYGEGWNFGEVAGNALFVQAAQGQLGGTHIATFSDRLRDGVRGGRPFDADPRLQGLGTGLYTAPNGCLGNGSPSEQRQHLLAAADLVQLGLAGTLCDFVFVSAEHARPLRGDELDYNGEPAGYADAPDEVVNYVDAHDNETLFDALALKLPVETPMSDRIRANTLCLAFPTLGQSAVMWHAGSDFLRSKSLDRNSYDSGDWFNVLDFSFSSSGFGVGLPPEGDNGGRWEYMRPLLALPELKPSADDMRLAHALALDLLRLRSSSRLFRLGDAALVKQKVSFPVSGTWAQAPGVIVLHLDDAAAPQVDGRWRAITVVFNAAAWPVRQQVESLRDLSWELHPVQVDGADDVVRHARVDDGMFSVPGRTAAVFVAPR